MSCRPLVPWIGGKGRLAERLLPLFPEHQCYVEAFAGAGALFFFRARPAELEILNDINADIVNLYRVVKYHFEELYAQFKWVVVSRQNWEWLRDIPAETLTDIQRAARFLYLQKLAFGGKVDGQCFGTMTTGRPRFNLLNLENDLVDAHARLAQTLIEHLDWQACCHKYDRPHSFIYLDPPYWQTEGYGVDFGWEQYELIVDFATKAQSKVMISHCDHPDIRSLFERAKLHILSFDHEYTLGGTTKAKQVRELVATNYKPQRKPMQLALDIPYT